MFRSAKSLWLLAPPGLVLAAWFATQRDSNAESVAASNSDFVLVAGSLLVTLAISAATFVFVSRRRQANRSTPRRSRIDPLRVVQSLRISSRDWVHAIEFESTTLLIGASDGNMVLLDTIRESTNEPFPSPTYSDGGVDLRDTPREREQSGAEPRTLSDTRVARTALTAASLDDFKAQLEQARKTRI